MWQRELKLWVELNLPITDLGQEDPGFSRWAQGHGRLPQERKRDPERCNMRTEVATAGFEDGGGAVGQGMRCLWKLKGRTQFSPEDSRRNQPCLHLDLVQ